MQTTQLATLTATLRLDTAEFEAGIGSAAQSAKNLGSKLSSLGGGMSLAFTAPLAAMGGAALKSAAQFEQGMNVLGKIAGATSDEVEKLKAQALELGAVTSYSAGEAVEGMMELAKAGMNVREIMAGTPAVLDLAAASGLSLADSAAAVAAAVRSFALPVEDSSKVVNLFAAAVNSSALDMGELVDSLQMSSAVFSANKQSLNELVVALGLLANRGLRGSDAGTSLKTMLMRLTAPTDDAAELMAGLGVKVFDASGNIRKLSEVVNDLRVALKDMNDEQRASALTTLFGSDAIRAASILTQASTEEWNALAKSLEDQSAASGLAEARMSGLAGAVEYFKGSVDSFLISTALPFLDSLSGLVRAAADLISAFGALPAPIKNAALAITGGLAVIGPTLVALGAALTFAGTALSAFGALIAFVASPVGLLALALAGLGAAIYFNAFGVRDALLPAWDALRQALAEGKKALDSLGVLAPLQRAAGDLRQFANYVALVAVGVAQGKIEIALGLKAIGAAAQALGTKLRAAGEEIFSALDLRARLSALVKNIAAQIESAFSSLSVTLDLSKLFSNIKLPADVSAKIAEGAKGAELAVQALVGRLRTAGGEIMAALDLRSRLPALIKNLAAQIESAFSSLRISIDLSKLFSSFKLPADLSSKIATELGKVASAFSKFPTETPDLLRRIASEAKLAAPLLALLGGGFASLAGPVGLATTLLGGFLVLWDSNAWGVQEKVAAGLAILSAAFERLGVGASLSAPSLEQIKATIGGLGGKVLENLPALASFDAAFASWRAAAPALQQALGALGAELVGLWQEIVELGVALNIAEKAVLGLNVALLAAAGFFAALPTVALTFIENLTLVVRGVKNFTDELGKMVAALAAGDTDAAFAHLGGALNSLAVMLDTVVLNAVRGASDAVQIFLNLLAEGFVGLGLESAAAAFSAMSVNLQNATNALSGARLSEALMNLLDFEWPSFPSAPKWLTNLLDFEWPSLPSAPKWLTSLLDFEWPSFPSAPSWIDKLFSPPPAFSVPPIWGGKPPGGASGRLNWRGGAIVVGETGRELVTLPSGARIFSASQTRDMFSAERQIVVNVNAQLASELDIQALTRKIVRELRAAV